MAAGQSGSGSNSIMILVLGILSLFLCSILTGIPAWIMGKQELAKIDSGQAPAEGRTMAQIGMILGIVSVVLFVVGIIMSMVMFGSLAALIGAAGSTPQAPSQ